MDDKARGIRYIIFAALLSSIMSLLTKTAARIPTYEIVFFSHLVPVICVGYLMKKRNINFVPNSKSLTFLRALFGILSTFAYFKVIELLHLAEAVVFNRLSPFFITLFSILFLNEKFSLRKIAIIILAFSGAILVVKPQLNYSFFPFLLGLITASFSAIGYMMIRALRNSEEYLIIIFYYGIFGVILSFPLMLLNGFVIINSIQFFLLLLIGVALTLGQASQTITFTFAPASELSVYLYLDIIFSLIIGMLLWKEYPDILSILGILLILSTSIIENRMEFKWLKRIVANKKYI